MGTRHEIKISIDGEVKVCKYGQWDGYPSGQGVDIAEFIQTRLIGKPKNVAKFKKAVRQCSFMTQSEIDAVNANPNWASDYPWHSRDCGSDILAYILDRKVRKTHNSRSDGGESNDQWCEYFYEIDLDKDRIRVNKRKWWPLKEWTVERVSRMK